MYLEILPSLELFSTGEEFRRTDKINTVIPPMSLKNGSKRCKCYRRIRYAT